MAFYLVGDIQGCDAALGRLLAEIDFSASRDTLYVLGDMVNRGPDSLGTLRRLMALGNSAQCVLGNHDAIPGEDNARADDQQQKPHEVEGGTGQRQFPLSLAMPKHAPLPPGQDAFKR